MTHHETEMLLAPYRVLDLTDEKGLMCGKVLGDMGSDVIKVEPREGSPSRDIGPFYKDIPHREKSLYWFAFNTNKRGITLDLERADGQELFKRLVKTADIVVESFPPGSMASLGLGYDDLCKVKPDIIMTSISPYGQTGPYRNFKGSDLTIQAMAGYTYLAGDEDRPPVRISYPQAYSHAGAEAAVGTLMALYHRNRTGEGQLVDLSMQATMIWVLMNATPFPKLHNGLNLTRHGRFTQVGVCKTQSIWACKDGFVTTGMMGGGFGASSNAMRDWAAEAGMASDFFKNWDFPSWDFAKMYVDPEEQKTIDRIEEETANFLKTKTKAELYQRAISHRIVLAPCNETRDIWESPQLRAREFFVEMEHPELGEKLPYVGPFVKFNNNPISLRRRAPLIGEHNLEVYEELGVSRSELVALAQAGVI